MLQPLSYVADKWISVFYPSRWPSLTKAVVLKLFFDAVHLKKLARLSDALDLSPCLFYADIVKIVQFDF